jgi:hypothetical protein
MKIMKILSFALFLAFCIPVLTDACTCAYPTFEEEMKKAHAVFIGKVVQMSQESEGILRVDLVTRKKWKGQVAEKVTIHTPDDSAACGYPFQKQVEYLIFARNDSSEEKQPGEHRALEVSLCSLTKPVSDAAHELGKLNHTVAKKVRRDPFTEMRGDRIVENKIVPSALNIKTAVIVGITKKTDGFVALIRATNNKVYFLKVGDKLHDGVVAKIDSNSVTFRQYRGSRSVLIRKELRPFPDE